MKRITVLLLIAVLVATSFTTLRSYADEDDLDFDLTYDDEYYGRFRDQGMSINVYNFALYLSDGSDDLMDINKEFEELTGIKVYYTNYATSEELYAKLKSGGTSYDIVIPSDYMIGRMIEEDMLEPLDYANIPNARYIEDRFYDNDYDPGNRYSVPYAWNLVGLIYNSSVVEEEPTSWDVLWDEQYAGQILMFESSRDSFSIALSKLGYSMNTEDPAELREAAELLKQQKPLVQAYVQEQIFDKMEANEAALAPYYAGDAFLIENDDIEVVFPEDHTTSYFMEATVIPKGSPNKEAAEMYINFLNEPQVAADNMEFICYSTPNWAAFALLDEEEQENEINYPSAEVMANTEQLRHLSPETNLLIDELWVEILSDSGEGSFPWWILAVVVIAGIAVFQVISRNNKKKKEAMMKD